MGKTGVRVQVDTRIEAITRAISDLPDEFSEEAYQLWKDLQDRLAGLYDIRRCFCEPPELDAPSWTEEVLY